MASYLTDGVDVYDPKRKFAVTNWSDEDFACNWADPGPDGTGDNIYVLHAGETQTHPQYLAYFMAKHFVDREMGKEATKLPLNPDGTYTRAKERAEMAMNNRELRKPYEDKTIQEVLPGRESPEITAMRAQIRKDLIIEQGEGMKSEMHNNPDGTPEEFPDAPKKKAGRPKAEAEVAAGV